jgi:hypothetical protein
MNSISTRGKLGWLSMERDSDKQGPGRTGKAVCISGSEKDAGRVTVSKSSPRGISMKATIHFS